MSYFLDQSLWVQRISAILLSIFGFLALALAAVGVYGVMAYSVNQRRRELSLRVALGSRRSGIVKAVLGEALGMIAVGLVLGWSLAYFLLEPVLATQLLGVDPSDPGTFALQSLWLVLVALLGSLMPLRRAVQADPMALLRGE